jgi:hypothetical protein
MLSPAALASASSTYPVRCASINERSYTSPDRMGPPGAEIEQNIDLATSFSLKNQSKTAAIESVLVSIETLSPAALASASSTYPAPPPPRGQHC